MRINGDNKVITIARAEHEEEELSETEINE